MWPKQLSTVAAAVGTITAEMVITSVRNGGIAVRASETGRARTVRATERDAERERVSPSD